MDTNANRILIVGEDAEFGKRLRGMLADEGYLLVGEIASGRQAVERIQALHPDVVVLDQKLRDVDGITVAQQISAHCPTPVVVLTDHGTPEWVAAVDGASVGCRLVKPVTPRQLVRAIDVALARFDDMQELGRLKAALRASEHRHTLAQRAANMGSWEWDVRSGTLRWSERIEPVLGLAPGKFKGTYAAFLRCVHPEDRRRVRDAVDAWLEKDAACDEYGIYEMEHRIVWPDGSVHWVAEMGHVMRDPQGKALRVAGVVQDVTAQKQAEARRCQAIADAQQRQAEVAALLESSRAILQHRGFSDAARAIFDACKQLIGATSGYVALLTEDGAENEVLFLDAGGLPCTVDPALPMPIRGLRSEAYHTRAPVYDNDFHSSEWMKFMPHGHVRLDNVLFAPLILEDKAIGLLGLANKSGDFTDRDAHMAAAFGELAAIALRNSRTLDALQASEERFRMTVHRSPVGVGIVDGTGQLIDCNTALADIVGYRREELLGLNFADFTHPDDLEREWQLINALLEGRTTEYRMKKRYIHRDGHVVWVDVANSLFKGESGALEFGFAFVQDITARVQAEEALYRRNQYLSALQETTLELISQLDLDTLLENIVKRAGALVGTNSGFLDLLDQKTHQLKPRVGMGALTESLQHAAQPGVGLAGTVWQTGRPLVINDYDRWANRIQGFSYDALGSIIGVPLLSGGQVLGVLGLAYDAASKQTFGPEAIDLLTQFARLATIAIENSRLFLATQQELAERVRAEQEIERYAAELERSNQELEQFAYIISHDLQEPLRMVQSYMDLLVRRYGDQLDGEAEVYIDYAIDGAGRMQEMIRALLRLSRVKTRGEAFAPTDVEAALARAQQALSRAIEEAGAEVTHDPLPTVLADQAQLVQVLQNLIANGIKFCREDEPPHVHVSAQQKGDEWIFSVADNGIGIAPRQFDRLFQIFQRLHTREEYPGTGIGLALCRRIIERHGGRIWVESEPGAGATFYFTLPDRQETAHG